MVSQRIIHLRYEKNYDDSPTTNKIQKQDLLTMAYLGHGLEASAEHHRHVRVILHVLLTARLDEALADLELRH
jgi:hypothetical protein